MKNNIKKLSSSLLLALTLVSLASCGPTDSGSDLSDNEGNRIVKIMFHVDERSAEGIAYKKRITQFNHDFADKHIKAQAKYIARTSGASAYETELSNKLVDGTLDDIITFDAPNCASYAKSGILYDITNLIDVETKNDFITTSTYQNKLYGLPIQESSAGFYYNKKIFADAGIDVSSYTVDNPWTFDQFKDVCDKLRRFNTSSDFAPVDMRLDATKDETAPFMLYPFIYASGGSFTSDDGYVATGYFNSAASYNGFKFLKDLIDKNYTSYAIGASDFFVGKTGMYLSSGWTIPELDQKYPQMFPNRDSWGLLPYPKEVQAASATGSWCFGLTNNNTKDKSAAIELIKYLTSAESSKVITDATGMIPARKSVETNYKDGDPEKILMEQLQKTGKARPSTVGYPKFSTCFNQVIAGLKGNDLKGLIDNQANVLQQELNRLK